MQILDYFEFGAGHYVLALLENEDAADAYAVYYTESRRLLPQDYALQTFEDEDEATEAFQEHELLYTPTEEDMEITTGAWKCTLPWSTEPMRP